MTLSFSKRTHTHREAIIAPVFVVLVGNIGKQYDSKNDENEEGKKRRKENGNNKKKKEPHHTGNIYEA